MAIYDEATERRLITRLRAIALWMIVMAHCIALPAAHSGLAETLGMICESVAQFGVWIFFVIGGYLYAFETRRPAALVRRKLQTLVLPWLFTGTLVYFWTYLRRGEASGIGLLQFVGGYGSYLWYMAVFVGLLLIFLPMRKYRYAALIPVAYGIVMSVPRMLVIACNGDPSLLYLLCGAWPLAFGLGFLANKFRLQNVFAKVVAKAGGWMGLVFLVAFAAVLTFMGALGYWSAAYVPLSLLLFPALVWIVSKTDGWIGRVLDEIGRVSFGVYLLHMPIAGIISNLFCRFDRGYLVIARPFFVIGICWCGIRVFEIVLQKIGRGKWLKALIGLR